MSGKDCKAYKVIGPAFLIQINTLLFFHLINCSINTWQFLFSGKTKKSEKLPNDLCFVLFKISNIK